MRWGNIIKFQLFQQTIEDEETEIMTELLEFLMTEDNNNLIIE
jgi:hypothetical protein